MMRVLLALVLLAAACSAQAGEFWSGLWRNADQRGEALLQQGDAAAAAKVYTDARRKAYAEFKAGDYPAAAQDLSAFDDGEAHYNRGNALAHAGDLQGALDAYDAALKRDPHNQDAQHNRALVADALKQKTPPEQNAGPGQPGDGKQAPQQNGNQGSSSPQQGRNGESSAPGKDGKNDQQAQAPTKPQAQDAKPGDKSGEHAGSAAGQMAAAQTPHDTASARQGKPQADASKQAGAAPQPAQAGIAERRDDAEQARRDAAASLAVVSGKPDNTANGKAAQAANPAPSEQKLAQEQWLRGIPDDPGGLLRRKFLIEHAIRQQKAQP